MPDLRARILERVDQLEALARAAEAAAQSPWNQGDPDLGDDSVWGHCGLQYVAETVMAGPDAAAHIATWDPQAVLTLCAGARELVTWASTSATELTGEGWPVDYAYEKAQTAALHHVARMLGLDPDGHR